ncbi:beta-glucosidase 11 isoform X2 [Morus notabilis]|uniref:beta-glucosidase 11 isoform X2 n=1 Tax=Morus notabilis TaxID=981085 RepID=UPI000CED0E49|nr:beta-glucosidase 11 isoform X2 [Morus notabilis]
MWGICFSLFALMSLGLLGVIVCGNVSRDDFPTGFVFGAGGSAYQTEGAANLDGRTPSIFDTFAHAKYTEGAGNVACDGYHKYKEDIQLMVETGLEAYRFSISWSRLIPNGRGPINPKGLQYYNNFINELVSHGIQPHVTLHHFDHPQVLEDQYGGWVSRKIVKDFTRYADVCFREFGDRVKHWTTINEANMFVIAGYDWGQLPPQRCSQPFGDCSKGNSSTEPYIAAHHILLAHASAYRLYEKNYKDKQHGFIGFNILSFSFVPQTQSNEDEIATKRAIDFFIGWFLNPLVFGDYPDLMKKNAGSRIPAFTVQESKSVRSSFDFLGLNYYRGMHVNNVPNTLTWENRDAVADVRIQLENVLNDTSTYEYPSAPWGLAGVLQDIKQHYNNPPIYIHENGQRTRRNLTLVDWARIEYLQAYIGGVMDTIRDGTNVKGYFVWSFMDSFELMDGYESRFGLYYVDFDDSELKRLPKLSAHWYSHFLKRNNITLDSIVLSPSRDYI